MSYSFQWLREFYVIILSSHKVSGRCFSAAFMSLNPCFVGPFNNFHNTGTKSPRKVSRWTNRTFGLSVIRISKVCSPSNRPAIVRCPSQRSSLSKTTLFITGLIVMFDHEPNLLGAGALLKNAVGAVSSPRRKPCGLEAAAMNSVGPPSIIVVGSPSHQALATTASGIENPKTPSKRNTFLRL